jgi:hypothetical protein
MNARHILILAGVGAFLWSVRNWRLALQGAMVLVVIEGALRKWVLPGSQDLVYFAKDIVLLAAYVGFWNSRAQLRFRLTPLPGLAVALGLAAFFGALQVFNPRLPSLALGVLGFRSYFLYAPLAFVLPAAFDDDAALGRFLKWYLLIPIPVGLLAGLQFFAPGGSALNVYARGGADTVSTFGSSTYVRVTGTFSYISGYGGYLLASAILLLIVFATVRWRLRGHLRLYAALTMTILGMLMTGSRGPIFILAVLFPAYWVLAVAREAGGAATAGRLLVAATLLGLLVANAAPEALGAFRGRAASASDFTGRLASPFTAPWHMLDDAGALGFGIGSTHQAASVLLGSQVRQNWLSGAAPEAESGKVMLELGPLGFLLVYFLRVYLAAFALRCALRLKTRFHRALATGAFLQALVAIPGGVIFDPTGSLYYWFLIGLLTLAVRLDETVGAPATAMLPAPVPAVRPWPSPASRSH